MNQTEKTATPDSNVKHALRDEVKSLRALRDELKLQAHLFKAEAKDSFMTLENSFRSIEEKMNVVEQESAKSLAAEAQALVKELKEQYASFKKKTFT